MTFAKFIRISFLQNTSGRLLLLVGKHLFKVNKQEQHSWKLFQYLDCWIWIVTSTLSCLRSPLKDPPHLDKGHKTYIRPNKTFRDVLEVFWTSYVCSIYVLCPGVYSESYLKTFWSNVKNVYQTSDSNIFDVNEMVMKSATINPKRFHTLIRRLCCWIFTCFNFLEKMYYWKTWHV